MIKFGIFRKPVLNAFKPLTKLVGIAFTEITVQSFNAIALLETLLGNSLKPVTIPFLRLLSILLISEKNPLPILAPPLGCNLK